MQRVAPGEFLNDKQETGTIVNDSVANHGLMIHHHLGHVTHKQRLAVPYRNDHIGQGIRRYFVFLMDDGQDVPDG